MNLAAYRNYKTTEVPWLGDVPSHWEVRRLRTVLRLRNEKNSPVKTEQILSLSIAHGVTLYSHEGRGGNKRKGDITAYKIAHAGDIVLNSMNVIVGAVGLSRYTGAISPVYYALFPATDEVDIKYYDKVFGNPAFQRYLLIYGKGILIKKSNTGKLNTIRMKISPDDLKGTLLPIPPKDEQQQIARFLDWQTAQINKFIRNKRRLIELLKEQKQNVINQAVTRGLDPKVKFKPSGVPWIGDIPEHWEVRRLKYILREVDERSKTGEEQHLSMSQKHGGLVRSSEIEERRLMSDSYAGGKLCKFGDIVLNRLKAHLGVFAHAPCDGVISPDYSVFQSISDIEPVYYEYLLRSTMIRPELRIRCKGIVEGFWRLYSDDFLSLKVPVPRREEQLEIIEGIEARFLTIDQTILRTEREIDLMREYRTRLISDVVSGQVDVRGIEVPEVAEDELLDAEEETDEMEESEEDAVEVEE